MLHTLARHSTIYEVKLVLPKEADYFVKREPAQVT